MSLVRNKCCLALVSRHSTAPGRDETFAKIWGMDDPLSKTLTTNQRRILPAYSAQHGTVTPKNTTSDAQHLDSLTAGLPRQAQGTVHQLMEAVTAWI